jgi:radical SAM protein (TIGR01212 family)
VSSTRPFRRLSGFLRDRYGQRVFKVSLHGGFSCPNRDGSLAEGGCTFCLGEALHPVGFSPGQPVEEQLSAGMAYIRRRHRARRFVAYYQDYSATHAPVEELAEMYRPALQEDRVVALAVSTRPDCLPGPTLDLLERTAECKDLWLELGLQIADDAVLARLNRWHTVADVEAAVDRSSRRGLPVCVHVIIGLPGVTRQIERHTADLLVRLGVWGVKLHAFHVLRGTVMERMYRAGEVRVLGVDEHADRVVDFVERLPPETVIHRVTAEAPRRLTVAPEWTINKLAAHNRVLRRFGERGTWQGRATERGGGVDQ